MIFIRIFKEDRVLGNTACICTKPLWYDQLIPTTCGDLTGDSGCINSVPCCFKNAQMAGSNFGHYYCDDSNGSVRKSDCLHVKDESRKKDWWKSGTDSVYHRISKIIQLICVTMPVLLR